MNIYHVDCWCSHNPGKGGWRVLLNEKQIHREDHDFHSNNFYELSAIHTACQIANESLEPSTIFSDSRVALGWVRKNPSFGVLNRDELLDIIENIRIIISNNKLISLKFWSTRQRGENPADFGRKPKRKKWRSMVCRRG